MRLFKRLSIMLCTAIASFSLLTLSCFAASYDETITTVSTKEDVKKLVNYYRGADTRDAQGNDIFVDNTSHTLKGGETIVLDKTYGAFACKTAQGANAGTSVSSFQLCFDSEIFNAMTQEEQKKATQEMVSTVSKWGLSTDATSKFSNAITNNAAIPYSNADAVAALFNQGADINSAMGWFAPFQGVVGLILGILVVILMVLLIGSTILDLVYIGLPTARMAMDNKAESADKAIPFGISQDAHRIIKESMEDKGGKSSGNLYLKYFKSRIITYIILAVCILYLVSGQIGQLIGGLLDMVKGIG